MLTKHFWYSVFYTTAVEIARLPQLSTTNATLSASLKHRITPRAQKECPHLFLSTAAQFNECFSFYIIIAEHYNLGFMNQGTLAPLEFVALNSALKIKMALFACNVK